MTDQPIVLLGASGFIGNHLLDRLSAEKRHVIALARASRPHLPQHPNITWVFGDIRDPAILVRLFSDPPRAVIHAAGSHTPSDSANAPASDIETNLVPLVRSVELAVRAGVRRYVFLSSGGTIYGPTATPIGEDAPPNPIGAYGLAKLTAEQYLRLLTENTGTGSAILRLSNVYGPGQVPKPGFGFVPTAILRALRDEEIPLFNNGHDIRDYVYIDDVLNAITACLDDSRSYVLNIGSGQGTSGLEIMQTLEAVMGKPLRLAPLPGRTQDVSSIVLDTGRAGQILGWQAQTPLSSGLAATKSWLQTRFPS